MTCWMALGQAVALLIGLGLLVLPNLSFCVSVNCGGHSGWGEVEEKLEFHPGARQLWKRCGKSSGILRGCGCQQAGDPSFTHSN